LNNKRIKLAEEKILKSPRIIRLKSRPPFFLSKNNMSLEGEIIEIKMRKSLVNKKTNRSLCKINLYTDVMIYH